MLDLEYRSKCNNLLFDGIAEKRDGNDTDCKNAILVAIDSIPNLQPDQIKIARCYWLGPFHGRDHSLIVNFESYQDHSMILNNRKHLPKGVYVNEDFPNAWQERRRVL